MKLMKWLLVGGAAVLASQAQARVDYAIDLSSPEHHSGEVRIDFPATSGPYLDVKMPAWRTGRYSILNLANGVRRFSAADASGRPLSWQKVDKSTWRVALNGTTPVRVTYEIYGNELGLRSRHIDDSHAYLDASAVFMYADQYRRDDVTVRLKVPSGWTSVSGMQSAAPHHFVAANWDILVDSPIETGISRRFSFREGGRDYEVLFWGDGNYDSQQTVSDLKKIVAQAPTVWSSYPFQRYVFMIHATDGVGGATEHRNSTVIQIPRYRFQPRDAYLDFLSTASHEFIHTWNVKAYRPAGLVPYDYQQENYSDLLWVAEGSTSYFSDQLLLRAGITKQAEYFRHLADVINAHRRRPGTAVQSVSEASFDEWIASSGDRANNASVDIYTQGEVVSWMLDIALLEQTGGRVSYRDVHDALYRRFPADDRGFTDADMLQILQELTGRSWAAWWARNVKSPTPVDFDALLRPVGLKLVEGPPQRAWVGWAGEPTEGGIRLTAVARGSSAWNAGFTPGDVIVAYDGARAAGDRFKDALSERKPGERVRVTYFRRDRLAEKSLVVGSRVGEAKVAVAENATPAQRSLFNRWLLVPFAVN